MEAATETIIFENSKGPLRTPKVYKVCDGFTQFVLMFYLIFAPWAFGSTDEWTEWTLSFTSYALGLPLIIKWLIRWKTGYRPPRQDDALRETDPSRYRKIRFATRGLAVCTVLILGYILISALNARANFHFEDLRFEYYDKTLKWLPTTYDASATWDYFWHHLGFAIFFWAARDWLLGKSSRERFLGKKTPGNDSDSRHLLKKTLNQNLISDRLKTVLWLLCINGGLLALVSILQRLSGTDKLLWIIQPRINSINFLQFGPWAYRSNAAQYFNLIWPMCLGFWMLLSCRPTSNKKIFPKTKDDPKFLLIPISIILLICPFLSYSRGGAITAFVLMFPFSFLLWKSVGKGHHFFKIGVCLFLATAFLMIYQLSWSELLKRLERISQGYSGREKIFVVADQIQKDFKIFGIGGGAFPAVYKLYKPDEDEWNVFVHDDYRETLICFGFSGSAILVMAMLCILFIRMQATGSHQIPWQLALPLVLAFMGLCFHAKLDFPFQVHSIKALALLYLCILST